jgi:hypothetical protein
MPIAHVYVSSLVSNMQDKPPAFFAKAPSGAQTSGFAWADIPR